MNEHNEWKSDRVELVEALLGVGTAWARYGIDMGKAALETSASSLQSLASVLGHVGKTLEPEQAPVSDKSTPFAT